MIAPLDEKELDGAIALVGIGCRFPGGVADVSDFWRLLVEGRDAIGEIPRNRFDVLKYFDPRPGTPGRIVSLYGGYLDEIEGFDARFFGISPREAEFVDPQQRLLLETAWEALEDGGMDAHALRGSRTGVYVGQWLSDFEARVFADTETVEFRSTTGSGRYASAGRVSYAFGLRGPSLTIDTACSSSLVAIHLAVQALRRGECDMALAGGANVILQPHIHVAYSQSRMMAPDGRCKFADAQGDGYVRSEGAALVALKRLTDARVAGDRVYALLRGSAINNDGDSSGFFGRPGERGHQELLRNAYHDAGVDPSTVGYIEAHGTGTRAGDPVEIRALGAVLGAGRPPSARCHIGSVKTNIGHAEGAAGIAGLIKAALSLREGAIPASLHFIEPNPLVPWADLPFDVPTSTQPWLDGAKPRRAGVNAFGISGTNAHVVLESAPPTAKVCASDLPTRPALLVLSARGPEALNELARRYAARLTGVARGQLDAICWSAATRRTALSHRAAFVADDADGMAEQLLAFAEGVAASPQGELPEAADTTSVAPVFVVPGQGGQWIGMARDLMRCEPAFASTLTACDEAARPWLDLSLVDLLASDDETLLGRVEVIQPLLTALSIAFADWLASVGIEPRALVGHSMGEVGAAYLAGALDLDQTMRVVCRRSVRMSSERGCGAMAMVALPASETRARLVGREAQLSLAAANGPTSSVVAGDPAALAELMAALEADSVFTRLVNVDVASHSPQMAGPSEALRTDLDDLVPHPTRRPLYSTLLGSAASGESFDANYWGRNLREPVQFETCIGQLLDAGARTFVELGPHPVLVGAVQDAAKARGIEVAAIACGRRDVPGQSSVMLLVGALWVAGHAIDWARLLPRAAPVDLPLYPWQRERHWPQESAASEGQVGYDTSRPGHHVLLGRRFEPAGQGTICWETMLAPAHFTWLADHVVRGSVLFPGAAFVEVALAAAREARPQRRWALADVEFVSAWALASGATPRLQIRMAGGSTAPGRFDIYGRDGPEADWQRRAGGRIVDLSLPAPLAMDGDAAEIAFSHETIYARLATAGLAYGPSFRGLVDLKLAGTKASATVRLDRTPPGYEAFPPLLDTLLQALAAAIVLGEQNSSATPVPVRLGSVMIERPLPADQTLTINIDVVRGDIDILDADAGYIGALRGVVFERLGPAALSKTTLLRRGTWAAAPSLGPDAPLGPVAIVGASAATAAPLLAALTSRGVAARHCVGESIDKAVAWTTSSDGAPRGHLVLLAALDIPAVDDGVDWIEQAWRRVGDSVLALVRPLGDVVNAPPRVWLITRRAVACSDETHRLDLGGAALWGLGRVWAHEQPALDVTLIDLDGDNAAVDLADLMATAPAPRQLALRNGRWQALSLAPWNDQAATASPTDAPSLRAAIGAPGEPDTLRWEAATRPAPNADAVEVEVTHAGLNFMNLMSALGIYPGYEAGVGPLGIECAGRVTRVGNAVTHVRPGDSVIAIGHGCLQRHALVHGDLVTPLSPHLDRRDAATMPIAFLTAIHALDTLARLAPGETVLVHSAAGGVGLAALQVARRSGAQIIASAGTEAKRALLREMGIEHVVDSRSAFADAVRAATGGRGVDVVLNSLAGAAIGEGLRCLAPYGRFVELGKRDIYGGGEIALAPFRANLSYFAVDLDRMMQERPEVLGRGLRELIRDADSGVWRPLPSTCFTADQLVAAFKGLIPGTHVGKHIVLLDPPPANVHPSAGVRARLRCDGCYVVTGGLGALGLEVARWLAGRGVAALMLVGRSSPSQAARETIALIEAQGTKVLVAACDVADRNTLAVILDRARRDGGPLRGVFHAAGALADATLGELTGEALRAPRDGKVLGAWNLDRLTDGDDLDAFVLFSSVAALFGTPGQANYAAANAVLDALAHDRRARGRPGLAVALGPVADRGLAAAEARRGDALERLGFDGIAAADAIDAIDLLIASGVPHAVCAAFDANRWLAATAHSGRVGLVTAVDSAPSPAAAPAMLSDMLAAAPAGPPRRTLLEGAVREEVAAVLRMAPRSVPTDRALKSLGLDSLMALELRNRLEKRSGAVLSPTLAWNHPTVGAIAGHLAERLQLPLDAPTKADDDIESLLVELEQMSDDEARALLAQEAAG